MAKETYTVIEVARVMNVHKTTIFRMIRDGKLGAVDVSKPGSIRADFRIHRSHIDEFMKLQRYVPTPKD